MADSAMDVEDPLQEAYGAAAEKAENAPEAAVEGKEAAPDDRLIPENLTALQNRKKMKMSGYGEQWYQFGLEQPRMAGVQQQQMGHPRMRGAGRRR